MGRKVDSEMWIGRTDAGWVLTWACGRVTCGHVASGRLKMWEGG